MKTFSMIMLAVAFVPASSQLRAEDKPAETKTVGEKTADAWDKTKETAKAAGHSAAVKTKEVVDAVENAVSKPDADAHQVNVEITDKGIHMTKSLPAGKTAFMVRNSGKEKHNFEIEGADLAKSFWLAIAPGDSKILQVDLKAGSYEADCKLHRPNEPKVKLTVK